MSGWADRCIDRWMDGWIVAQKEREGKGVIRDGYMCACVRVCVGASMRDYCSEMV